MQLSGSVTVEIPVDRLAERVADIIVARLQRAAREADPFGQTEITGFPVGDPGRVGTGAEYERDRDPGDGGEHP